MNLSTTELCEIWRALETQRTALIVGGAEWLTRQPPGTEIFPELRDRIQRVRNLSKRIDGAWQRAEKETE